MPSVFVPLPTFPNVPQLPGVPQLARPPINVIAGVAALVPSIIQTLQVQGMPDVLFHAVKSDPVWGVFDSFGSQVLNPESMLAFATRSEYRVSDYPVQDGQFASYDKVVVPTEIMLRMGIGKTLQDRLNFEDACGVVAASLDVFTIITPEKTFLNMNAFRFEINRVEKKGAFYIEAEMYFRQINSTNAQYSTVAAAASNTQNAQAPSAIPPASLGNVQPVTPSAALAKLTTKAIQGLA